MSTEHQRLREKLCRELAQSEHDAVIQTAREAARLHVCPPAEKLRAIAAHAEHLRPRMNALMIREQPVGIRVGRLVGELFSGLRHLFFDRMLSAERSYRATLLGVRHGIDAAWLLRDVARREEQIRLFRFCDDLIAEREVLLRDAERALSWFADHPEIAMASGARIALGSGSVPRPAMNP
jgi:hypothetical protein